MTPANETRTLLYVEDDPSSIALIETLMMRRPQWQLVTASTGTEGLRLAQEQTPDLMLLDLDLPDLAGEAVLRARRAHAAMSMRPIVILSR